MSLYTMGHGVNELWTLLCRGLGTRSPRISRPEIVLTQFWSNKVSTSAHYTWLAKTVTILGMCIQSWLRSTRVPSLSEISYTSAEIFRNLRWNHGNVEILVEILKNLLKSLNLSRNLEISVEIIGEIRWKSRSRDCALALTTTGRPTFQVESGAASTEYPCTIASGHCISRCSYTELEVRFL